ncbi:hypothetical protein ACFVIM_15560 [Streptomyces sp. NPDC057638]|uniref:hypothetical protein n=1 Tax=Streptomyces sp. NPDC057638 TaxID=3346190 RepID=UPI0036765DDA
MRPGRFQEFVIDLAKNDPGVTRVQTLAEEGETKVPCGLAITLGQRVSRWGVVGQLPDGAKHEGFTDTPVHGTPCAAGEPPRPEDAPEAWLSALLGRAASPEIAHVERWSTRPDARPDYRGVTVRFHNSARVFVRLL